MKNNFLISEFLELPQEVSVPFNADQTILSWSLSTSNERVPRELQFHKSLKNTHLICFNVNWNDSRCSHFWAEQECYTFLLKGLWWRNTYRVSFIKNLMKFWLP